MKMHDVICGCLFVLSLLGCSNSRYIQNENFIFDSNQRMFVNTDYDMQTGELHRDTIVYKPFMCSYPAFLDMNKCISGTGPYATDPILYDYKFYATSYSFTNGQKSYVLIRQIGNKSGLANHWNISNLSESDIYSDDSDYEDMAYKMGQRLDHKIPSVDSLLYKGKGIILAQNENFIVYFLNLDKAHKKHFLKSLKKFRILDTAISKELKDRGEINYAMIRKAYEFLKREKPLNVINEFISPPYYLFNDDRIIKEVNNYSFSPLATLNLEDIHATQDNTNDYVSFSKIYNNALYAIRGVKYNENTPQTIYDTFTTNAFKFLFNKRGEIRKVESVIVYYHIIPSQVIGYESCSPPYNAFAK